VHLVIRILAYVHETYGAEDYSTFEYGPIPKDHNRPARLLGYVCDVTVEVETVLEGQRRVAIVDHYGDGQTRETLKDAQRFILETTGVLVQERPEVLALPPPATGEHSRLVAQMVREFEPTSKPGDAVEAESWIKSLGSGLTPWQHAHRTASRVQ